MARDRACWLLLAFVGLGALLRIPLLDRAVTSDELAVLWDGRLVALWADAETAVNPPLWRALLALLADTPDAVAVGRGLALAAGLAGVAATGLAARAAAGTGAGLLAAACAATAFQGVRVSAEARAYPLAALALAVWLAALVAYLTGPGDRRRAGVGAAVAAAAVPWLHYAAVPTVAAVGLATLLVPRWRPAAALHLPAAAALLPLLPRILAPSAARVETPGSLAHSVALVVSLGQRVPSLGAPGDPVLPAALTAAAVAAALLAWRRLGDGARLLGVAAAAALLTPAALGAVQHVRPPVGALAAVPVIALLSAVVARLGRGRAVAAAALLAWFGLGTVAPLRSWAAHDPFRAVDRLAATWRDHPADAWSVAPPSAIPGLAWRLTGHTLRAADPGPCRHATGPCLAHEGTVFRALRPGEAPAGRVALAAAGDAPPGCAVRLATDGLVIADCPASTAGPPPGSGR